MPAFLSMGTAPPGGAFFVVGGALAEVFNGTAEGSSMTAEATSGSQENIRRLASGELDFALSNSAISYFAVRGTEGWDHERVRDETRRIQEECMDLQGILVPPRPLRPPRPGHAGD